MPIRTGAAYMAGLRDTREVWLAGKCVADVTAHPAFRAAIESIARLYDLQHQPAQTEALTYELEPGGPRAGMSFLVPRSAADVARRGRAFKLWADQTGGLMGRSPDFLNSVLTAFATSSAYFGQTDPRFAENVVRYYEYCRDQDLCLTHTITDPLIDRSRSAGDQDDPYTVLGLVREDDQGIIVRGAKLLGTLAPYADELLVYPLTPLRPDEERYALGFGVPLATPGLKVVCREPLAGDRTAFDHPLAARFDEMDAAVIFDDVRIPWERVFLKGSPAHANRLRAETSLLAFATHQATVRAWAKAELVFGVATLVAEAIGREGLPPVQEKLGEMVSYVQLISACVRAAEADARPDANGVATPAVDPLLATTTLFSRIYPRMIELLQLIGSSGLIMSPLEADLRGPIAADLGKFFRGAHISADERVRRFKVAADLAVDAFGQRQVLYERFYAGDPARLQVTNYTRFDRAAIVARAQRLVDAPAACDVDGAPASLGQPAARAGR